MASVRQSSVLPELSGLDGPVDLNDWLSQPPPGTLWIHGDLDSNTEFEMTQVIGLSFALLLFLSAIWANVSDSSLSQNKGAWVSHVSR